MIQHSSERAGRRPPPMRRTRTDRQLFTALKSTRGFCAVDRVPHVLRLGNEGCSRDLEVVAEERLGSGRQTALAMY